MAWLRYDVNLPRTATLKLVTTGRSISGDQALAVWGTTDEAE